MAPVPIFFDLTGDSTATPKGAVNLNKLPPFMEYEEINLKKGMEECVQPTTSKAPTTKPEEMVPPSKMVEIDIGNTYIIVDEFPIIGKESQKAGVNLNGRWSFPL
ncbi:hypothetical protein HAX54_028205 [Datura stramonium]|uniref:Uncharacterized protein n=1 Tax=Datura stramonium TaxID=4076 RepID=A0ABS8V6H5_DATST|nr:hypothetical protein [Datura stramonium]